MGVSGGPDSVALCVLTAHWKTQGLNASYGNGEFIEGLLAIIVDHGLRAESQEEANTVSNRLSKMGTLHLFAYMFFWCLLFDLVDNLKFTHSGLLT